MRTSLTLIALALVAAPARAQNQAPADSGFWQRVLNLPNTVDQGRQAGVPSGTIWGVLDSLRRARVPAQDAQEIVQEEVDAVKDGAPKENFGATVNAMLARGLRGRELAAAIHAEHARRGIGHGKSKGKGQGQGQGRGRKP
ncbi:MAG TPA: hypothetical protein VIV10_05955 [Gemmatimonadales bacterium]